MGNEWEGFVVGYGGAVSWIRLVSLYKIHEGDRYPDGGIMCKNSLQDLMCCGSLSCAGNMNIDKIAVRVHLIAW